MEATHQLYSTQRLLYGTLVIRPRNDSFGTPDVDVGVGINVTVDRVDRDGEQRQDTEKLLKGVTGQRLVITKPSTNR